MTQFTAQSAGDDTELDRVVAFLRNQDPDGRRWASVIRHTYDVIYNGQETGRFSWEQLMKTEKTHFGTLFEIFAQREFEFDNGQATDYRIDGIEVDAKWSQRKGGWMLPPEVFDRIALVVTGDDAAGKWSLGLVRVTEANRTAHRNRDSKASLSPHGKAAIHWLWDDAPLPTNILLRLNRSDVNAMLEIAGGVNRIAQLFRLAEGQLVGRSAILTVAHQLDAMRRLRGGSNGARQLLSPEGYLILSGTYHQAVARQLGLPVPAPDEFVGQRIVADPVGPVHLQGRTWRKRRREESINSAAPIVPMKWSDMSNLADLDRID